MKKVTYLVVSFITIAFLLMLLPALITIYNSGRVGKIGLVLVLFPIVSTAFTYFIYNKKELK